LAAPSKLRIAIRPSRILAAVLAAAHAVALSVAVVVTLPDCVKTFLAATILASGGFSILVSAFQRSGNAIVELEIGEGGNVSCRAQGGPWQEAQLLPSSFVAPWLTVLNLRMAGTAAVRHVLILFDNVDEEAFRRLRVLLRWSGATAEGSRLPEEMRR
jgi:toxin CptA